MSGDSVGIGAGSGSEVSGSGSDLGSGPGASDASGFDATPEARSALAALRARVGPVMLVQSGGCCAGSTPMCFDDGEFLLGPGDVLLGEVDGTPFYIDSSLEEAWGTEFYLLDVAPGDPEGFSYGAGDGMHFVTRGSACRPEDAPSE